MTDDKFVPSDTAIERIQKASKFWPENPVLKNYIIDVLDHYYQLIDRPFHIWEDDGLFTPEFLDVLQKEFELQPTLAAYRSVELLAKEFYEWKDKQATGMQVGGMDLHFMMKASRPIISEKVVKLVRQYWPAAIVEIDGQGGEGEDLFIYQDEAMQKIWDDGLDAETDAGMINLVYWNHPDTPETAKMPFTLVVPTDLDQNIINAFFHNFEEYK